MHNEILFKAIKTYPVRILTTITVSSDKAVETSVVSDTPLNGNSVCLNLALIKLMFAKIYWAY